MWFVALSYWWIDIKDHRKRLTFFLVVGMNSLFIYLFFEIVGDRPSRAQVSDSTFKLEFKYNAFPHTVASAMTGIQFDHAAPDTRGHGVVSYRFVVQ